MDVMASSIALNCFRAYRESEVWYMKPGTPLHNPFGVQDKVKEIPFGDLNLFEKPAAKPNPDVLIISVQSKEGKPIALLANYSLNYLNFHILKECNHTIMYCY
jgi:hypothetical protein